MNQMLSGLMLSFALFDSIVDLGCIYPVLLHLLLHALYSGLFNIILFLGNETILKALHEILLVSLEDGVSFLGLSFLGLSFLIVAIGSEDSALLIVSLFA